MPKISGGTVNARTDKTPAAPPKLETTAPGAVDNLRLALFGPPGSGKTVGACSGKGKKLLVLTEPDGDLPLRGRKDIEVVRPVTVPEMNDVLRALHAGEAKNYVRVVFDSVTFMFEIAGSKLINKAFEKGTDIRRAYGQAGGIVNQLIHDAVALPNDVVFTAQLKHEGPDEENGVLIPLVPAEGEYPVTLAVTPMVYKVLAPAVSVIGRTYKRMVLTTTGNKRVEYRVSFEDYDRSPAKNRLVYETDVADLDLDELKAALKGDA